jgi:hypothetical protein
VSILKTGSVTLPAPKAGSIPHFLKKIPEDACQVMPVNGHSVGATVSVAPKEIKQPPGDSDYVRQVRHLAVRNLGISG